MNIITKERIEREYRRIKAEANYPRLSVMQIISQRLGVPVRDVIAVVADIEVTEGA